MDDDIWDDEHESTHLPTSSNDKFEKDLEKLKEIHSNVIPFEVRRLTCRRDIRQGLLLDNRILRREDLMRGIEGGRIRALRWGKYWDR